MYDDYLSEFPAPSCHLEATHQAVRKGK